MKSNPLIRPAEPFSVQELALVDRFIHEQFSVVIRACRMEVAQMPDSSALQGLLIHVNPWAENRHLHLQLQAYQRGIALQLLLEKQLIEAQSYLHDPNEKSRDIFVRGAFKALYACEAYAFGDKAGQHIQEIINRLGLQIY